MFFCHVRSLRVHVMRIQPIPRKSGNWRAFLQPYYVLHAAVFASYFAFHHIALRSASEVSRNSILKWELQAILSLTIFLLIKYVRSITVESFLAQALLYTKAMVALLAFILDWRLLAWYLLVFSILFLLCIQPEYEGEDNVLPVTPLQLENLLLEGNQNIVWLVEFGAMWSPQCIQLRRLISNLSIKYAKSGVEFARVDVGKFPTAAATYGIAFGVALRQLPTLILFKGGNELSRVPEPSYEVKLSGHSLSESYIIEEFALDWRFIQTLSSKVDISNSFQDLKTHIL